ncbi:hypothetical protein IG631_08801 [Alternaria alternata]|nr:hypothetical protein IG631_08801 [Alternaria alternata]
MEGLSETSPSPRRRHLHFGSRLRASTPSDGPPRKLLRHVLMRLHQIPGSRVSTSIIHRRYGVDEA